MIGIARTIGRILFVLIEAGIITKKQAEWIIEPLKGRAESEDEK